MDVTVVSLPLMLDEAVFERAGNGAGMIENSSVAAAMIEISVRVETQDNS